jgi:hypothetical protein
MEPRESLLDRKRDVKVTDFRSGRVQRILAEKGRKPVRNTPGAYMRAAIGYLKPGESQDAMLVLLNDFLVQPTEACTLFSRPYSILPARIALPG